MTYDIDPISGLLVNELDALPEGAERLDAYLARRLPGPDWYALCEDERVQVRDLLNRDGIYDRKTWFVAWQADGAWHRLDLEPGERPRMYDTYCYILQESDA